ncbi:MAG: spore germination protein, partial [Oscillospiraceae bacterium]
IRRRIRSKNLIIETMQVGSKTKTELTLYYHGDYCPPQLVKTVKKRLEDIDLPMIFEAGYISPFVDTTKFSIFQATGYTERPDTFCAKLCEGKIGIMVDGTPYAMVYPHFFHENFVTNDDYTQRPYFASFIRLLRYSAFIIAIALPGLYVGFTAFAPQVLTEKLLFFIFSSKNNTPLPLFAEAMLITILLEIIKEAGLRLPAPIGHSVSLVAALIIGDAAISAGLIGSAILIVCAVSSISSFVIPSFYEPIIILRMVFILLAGIFGIPGIALSVMLLLINITNVNAAGYDYIFMFDLSQISSFKDGITKTSWRKMQNDPFDLRRNVNEK